MQPVGVAAGCVATRSVGAVLELTTVSNLSMACFTTKLLTLNVIRSNSRFSVRIEWSNRMRLVLQSLQQTTYTYTGILCVYKSCTPIHMYTHTRTYINSIVQKQHIMYILHAYIQVHIHKYECNMYIHIHTYIHTCMHMYYKRTSPLQASMHTYRYTYINMSATCTYTYIHTYIHTCMHMYYKRTSPLHATELRKKASQ